jgi:hypothetical protein
MASTYRALNETMEKLTTGIPEHKRFLSIAQRESKGSNCPCCVEIVAKRVFVLYLLEASSRGCIEARVSRKQKALPLRLHVLGTG